MWSAFAVCVPPAKAEAVCAYERAAGKQAENICVCFSVCACISIWGGGGAEREARRLRIQTLEIRGFFSGFDDHSFRILWLGLWSFSSLSFGKEARLSLLFCSPAV